MRATKGAYLMLAPALAGLFIFRVYPIVKAILQSLFTESFGEASGTLFVGFKNYIGLATDPVFWMSFKTTILFNTAITVLQTALALTTALLLNHRTRGTTAFRTIYLLPIGVSLPIACSLWGMVLDPNSGLANSLLAVVGLPPQPFLTSPVQAFWSIIAIASWRGVSYWAVFFLAGLQAIPWSFYEAAMLDGAGGWRMITRITLPLLRGVLLFVLVANTVANYLLFVPIYMLTGGGPQLSTNVLMYEVYKNAFIYLDMYRASAMATVLLALILVVVTFQFKFLGSKE